MAYGQGGGYGPRPPVQMHDVSSLNLKCKDCGTAITELPFNPDPSRYGELRCRDCMRAARSDRGPRRPRY